MSHVRSKHVSVDIMRIKLRKEGGNSINVNRLRKTKNTIRCLTDVESGAPHTWLTSTKRFTNLTHIGLFIGRQGKKKQIMMKNNKITWTKYFF